MFKHIRSYSTLMRTWWLLSFGVLLTIVLLSFFLFSTFSGVIVENAGEFSERSVKTIANNINRLYTDVYRIAANLGVGDADINTMMFQTEHKRLKSFAGFRKMLAMQSINPSIFYINIYNQYLDKFTGTIDFQPETEALLKESILTTDTTKMMNPYKALQMKVVAPTTSPTNFNVLNVFFYPSLSSNGNIGVLLVGIGCDYFQQYIASMDVHDEMVTMILDGEGYAISHPDKDLILKSFSDYEYVQKVFTAKAPSGYFINDVDGERMLVSYQRGERSWYYISLVPYSSIVSKLAKLRNMTILIALLTFFGGLLYSIFAARRSFSPIKSLLDNSGYVPERQDDSLSEIEYLTKQIGTHKKNAEDRWLLRDATLQALIRGSLTEDNYSVLDGYRDELDAPLYKVVLFSINHSAQYDLQSEQEKLTLRTKLLEYGNRSIAPHCMKVFTIPISENTVAFVIMLNSVIVTKHMYIAFSDVQKQFFDRTGCLITISTSSPVDTLDDLPDAYQDASNLLLERFFASNAEELIIFEQKRRIVSPSYNLKIENQIWQAIQDNDCAMIDTTVDAFIDTLYSFTYEYAQLYINILMFNLLTNCLNIVSGVEPEKFYVIIKRLHAYDMIDLVRSELKAFFAQLSELFIKPEVGDGNHKMLETAMQLAKEKYTDMNFTTNVAAQSVGLSITYFNRIFKKYTGQSYSAYLNSYRLGKVCTMLRTTDHSLGKICEEVGLANEPYCYTLFKKEYGLTPNQYRTKYSQ